MEQKDNWLDTTMVEFHGLLLDDNLVESAHQQKVALFVRQKLLESYKNGAQAERRKAFKKADATEA